jgi:hypothetical protein
MSRSVVVCLVSLLAAQTAAAQDPECRLYKVASDSLNISKEPRGDAAYIDVLDKADVVCLTRQQKVGDRDWGYIAYKVVKPDQRKPVEGWANMRLMQPLSTAEAAAVRGLTAAPAAPAGRPAAAAEPESDEVLRFSQPVPFGAYPVNGHSIEELIQGTPLFPPFEGLDEAAWKNKTCSTCHKWDRRALCEQSQTYVKNPKFVLRIQHPYGGPFKTALMQWAKTGCQ